MNQTLESAYLQFGIKSQAKNPFISMYILYVVSFPALLDGKTSKAYIFLRFLAPYSVVHSVCLVVELLVC
jgi:hypothetical protein